VVHTHGSHPDVLDAPVARAAGVPTLTTVHGFTGGDARNRVYEWLQRRAFLRFDAVVAVSEPLVALLAARGVRPERIHAIRNAWAPIAPAHLAPAPSREALGVPAGTFHVGWVGRLSPEKGADVLVRALARLGDLPLLVSFVGDGAGRARLEALAAAAGVAGRIRWRGLMPGAERLFPTFDAFVLSSRTEGTPMVLFEAMHAGTPIVASRVGGVPDVLGDTGLMVAPDDPAALAAAIIAVWRDPAAAQRRAAAARVRLAERFGREPWLRRYETLYRSLSR
jgi:glycosyltransferase involved in cell wall biosynthesis